MHFSRNTIILEADDFLRGCQKQIYMNKLFHRDLTTNRSRHVSQDYNCLKRIKWRHVSRGFEVILKQMDTSASFLEEMNQLRMRNAFFLKLGG